MDIRALAEQNSDYIIERRRYYHRHPELSFQEWETTKALLEDVKALMDRAQDLRIPVGEPFRPCSGGRSQDHMNPLFPEPVNDLLQPCFRTAASA